MIEFTKLARVILYVFIVQNVLKHCLTIAQRLEYGPKTMVMEAKEFGKNLDKRTVTDVRHARTRGYDATISEQILFWQIKFKLQKSHG